MIWRGSGCFFGTSRESCRDTPRPGRELCGVRLERHRHVDGKLCPFDVESEAGQQPDSGSARWKSRSRPNARNNLESTQNINVSYM